MKRAGTIILLLLMLGGAVGALRWLDRHPQHNPFAPFRLSHPIGWATADKLTALVATPTACHLMLHAGGVRFTVREATGSGACRLTDRTRLDAYAMRLHPNQPDSTCAVAAGLLLWHRDIVTPAAARHFGERVISLEHMGTTNCRRIAGGSRMSEHATGNAYDIAAFRLTSGRRVALIDGWDGKADEQAFLRDVRDGACAIFGTTLSPDFNAAHADHFHFDMAARDFGAVCR